MLRRGLIVRREEGIGGDSDENEAKLQSTQGHSSRHPSFELVSKKLRQEAGLERKENLLLQV